VLEALSDAGVDPSQLMAAPSDVITGEGLEATLDAVGKVDVLINKFGIFGASVTVEITDE